MAERDITRLKIERKAVRCCKSHINVSFFRACVVFMPVTLLNMQVWLAGGGFVLAWAVPIKRLHAWLLGLARYGW